MSFKVSAIMAMDGNGNPIDNIFTPTGEVKVLASTSPTAVQSTVYSVNTLVEIVADGKLHYKIGTDPTATTNDRQLPSGTGKQMLIPAGYKISVLSASSTATAYVGTEA